MIQDERLDGTTEDKKEESLRISLRGWMKQRDDAQLMINEIVDKLWRMKDENNIQCNTDQVITSSLHDSLMSVRRYYNKSPLI